jgi:hypothetical protein
MGGYLMDELTEYIHMRAKAARVPLDKYDPDYILGVVMTWLGAHNMILTETGLEKNDECN